MHESTRMISVNETADRLGVSRITIYRMPSDGRIPSIKLGSRRLIAESTIDALIASARTVPE